MPIGENVKKTLSYDLKVEEAAYPLMCEAIQHCESVRDLISWDLLQDILEEAEEHTDWLETQLELIDRMGLENYQQSQIS